MSQSESTATGDSPGGFYPSPPTSPRPVSTRDKAFARRSVDTPKITPKTHIITPREPAVKLIEEPPEDPTTPTKFTVSATDELLAIEERLVLETWKRALSLGEWRCGAIKWNNERCKIQIGAKKMEKIDSVLDLLRRPGASTSEIETHLDSLSKLVHCHFHDHPPCRESRMEEWLSALPGSPRPPTVERQLRNAFRPVPVKCTCMTRESNPCKVNVSIVNQNHCKKTVNVMVRIATAARDQNENGTLADFAKVLQYYMMCGNHRKNVSKSMTQGDWATAIDRFRTACHDEMSKRRSNIEKAGAISSTDEMVSTANGGVTDLAHCFTSKGHARYWERGLDTSSFHILGKNDFDEYRDSDEAIRAIAGSKLNTDPKSEKNEVHSGFVYLYKVPGNDGFVKVGFTTKAVQGRIEEWKKACNRDPTVFYPIFTAAKTVLHAHRVERLVHAELMEHRIRHYCERCEKQHVEWFEVSVDVAIAAVKKWSLWTAGKPYEEIEGSEWHLKEAEKNRLGHVATFVEELQEAVEIAESIKQAI